MAQSSDSNSSDGNRGIGSKEVEQILDHLIERVEATEKVKEGLFHPQNDIVGSDEQAKPFNAKAPALEIDDRRDRSAQTSLHDIEARAADLAERLSGSELSFKAASKMHLEEFDRQTDRIIETPAPAVEARIHEDDLAMETLDHSGVSPADFPEQADQPDETIADTEIERSLDQTDELGEQAYHVSEWDAEFHQKSLQTENELPVLDKPSVLSVSDRAPEALQFGEEMETSNDRPHNLEAILEPADDVEGCSGTDFPELQEIENQIEALSVSMKEQGSEEPPSPQVVQGDQPCEGGDTSDQESIDAGPGVAEQRLDGLETQIVHILDRVSLMEQTVGETVAKAAREETKTAVYEAFASSDIVSGIRAELDQAGEQRIVQEKQLSDSLDALYDALQDLGERMSSLENNESRAAEPQERSVIALSGIASSLLGSQVVSQEAEKKETAPEPEPIAQASSHEDQSSLATEELPTWLEDTTKDLSLEADQGRDEPADVFKTSVETPVVQEARVEEDRVEEALVEEAPAQEAPAQEAMLEVALAEETSIEETPVQEQVAPEEQHESLALQSAMENDVADDQPVAKASFEPVLEKTSEPQQEAETSRSGDFLQAARAAAQAANERAKVEEAEARESPKGFANMLKKKDSISFEEEKAPAQKIEPEVIVKEPLPATDIRPNSAAKNSLFAEKAEGPNFLLVFTSLILFATSALLLYGMAKNTQEPASIAKLNTVETGDQARHDQNGSYSKKRTVGENKERDKQSRTTSVERNYAALSAAPDDGADTLTSDDKMASTGMAQSPVLEVDVDITGAISRENGSHKTASLFDEYVGFSDLSPRKKKATLGSKRTLKQSSIEKQSGVLTLAGSGNIYAQYEVAERYEKGMGFDKDNALSKKWFEQSAKAGYAPALYQLATLYERGVAAPKNYKKAMQLYTSAAQKGNIKAMHNLAVLYTGGNLGKSDYRQAIKWYTKAAEQGVKDSQFNLAIIYQNGMGTSRNFKNAYKWYFLAARAGDKEAAGLMKDIVEEIPTIELQSLKLKLKSWKAGSVDKLANADQHPERYQYLRNMAENIAQ